jgi:hypothetical protein
MSSFFKRAVAWLCGYLPGGRRRAAAERTFKNVFAFVTPDRREAIIRRYMERDGVSRVRAMELAVKDRQRDADRYS